MHADRDTEQTHDQARDGERELLLDGDDGWVRGVAVRLRSGFLDPQFRNRHLADAGDDLHLGEHVQRVDVDLVLAGRIVTAVVDVGFGAGQPAAQAPDDDLDPVARPVDDELAFVGQDDGREAVVVAGGRQHDVLPDAVGPDRLDKQDLAWEPFVEHARLDLLRRLLGDQVHDDLDKGPVAGRNALDHHVERQASDQERHDEGRPEDPPQADAAGQEGNGFAVGGQSSKGDQESDQEGHRQRDAEGLRQEVDQEVGHGADRSTLGQEVLSLGHHRLDGEQECQDGQRQEKRHDRFANHVAVERAHAG